MNPLVDAVGADVDLQRRARRRSNARPSGNQAFDLFADEEVVRVGMAVEKLEAAVDAVVIGQGDDVHAPRFRDAIDGLGLRVAVARAQESHVAGVAGMVGVDVQVGPHHAIRNEAWQTVG